ncbi:MAG: glycosyltransferase family 2 protein [Anaerolineae bacterium]
MIVSWNVADLLARCLESVLASAAVPLRVVVVDNASTDGSPDMVEARFPEVDLVVNGDNVGFTRATNQGLRRLGALVAHDPQGPDTVVLLNPDTEVEGDAVATLVGYLRAHSAAGAAGPLLLWPDGAVQSSRRRFPGLLTALLESTPLEWHWPGNPVARRFRMSGVALASGPVDWVTGAALALRTAALREVGGLDEGFFMYSEELDLCRRLKSAGWETHFVPGARVIHHEGKSSEQAAGRRHIEFQRSKVRYYRKYHGRGAAAVVRAGILGEFALELGLEAAKLAVGHKPEVRRRRVADYRRILADGLAARDLGEGAT